MYFTDRRNKIYLIFKSDLNKKHKEAGGYLAHKFRIKKIRCDYQYGVILIILDV